jgi:hypothetical protein
LPNEALEILLEIYNDILRPKVFPDDWKYIVFFIPKHDKTNVKTYVLRIMCVQCTETNDKHAHILVARTELEILRNNMDFQGWQHCNTSAQ